MGTNAIVLGRHSRFQASSLALKHVACTAGCSAKYFLDSSTFFFFFPCQACNVAGTVVVTASQKGAGISNRVNQPISRELTFPSDLTSQSEGGWHFHQI